MSEERATGIILRVRPLTETSLIVHWLTTEFGRIATVAKGARRVKSPFRGKLDLYFSAEFTFQPSRRSQLHNLREINLKETRVAMRMDIAWLQQAAYCAWLIEQTTETDTPLPGMFELLKNFLDELPNHPPTELNVFAFEMKLLKELGLKPDLAAAKLSEGSKQILEKLVQLDWTPLLRIKLADIQTKEIRQFLHGFLIYHLDRLPPGRAAALGH